MKTKKIKQIIWPETNENGEITTEIIKISEPIFYIGVQAFPGTVLDFGASGTLTVNSTGFFEFTVPENMTIDQLTIDLTSLINKMGKINSRVIIDYLTEVEED